MKKMMMLLVGLLVAAPFVFAQDTVKEAPDTGMKTQIETDINMRAVLIPFEEEQEGTGYYIRHLQDTVSQVLKSGSDKLRYETLINLATIDPLVTMDSDVYHFMDLTNLFYNLLGDTKLTTDVIQPISEAGIDQYREFYNVVKDISGEFTARTYVLPTMAMWKNRSYLGLAPFRGAEDGNFWENPRQVAKMYNTMAEIDHEDAKLFLKDVIKNDDDGAYPALPEFDEESENQEQIVQNFFARFATAKKGSFASNDAEELRDFVLEIIKN